MNQKYIVRLSEEERKEVHATLEGANIAKSVRKRSQVLLMLDMDAGKALIQSEIAKRCGVSADTVSKLSRDYSIKGLGYCLRRRTHETPPRPAIVTGETEARIVALACGEAPEGRSRWTLRLLAEKVVELEIMEKVSHETIYRVLKKRNLSLT